MLSASTNSICRISRFRHAPVKIRQRESTRKSTPSTKANHGHFLAHQERVPALCSQCRTTLHRCEEKGQLNQFNVLCHFRDKDGVKRRWKCLSTYTSMGNGTLRIRARFSSPTPEGVVFKGDYCTAEERRLQGLETITRCKS